MNPLFGGNANSLASTQDTGALSGGYQPARHDSQANAEWVKKSSEQLLTTAQEAQRVVDEMNKHEQVRDHHKHLLEGLSQVYQVVTKQLSYSLFNWFKHNGFWPSSHTCNNEMIRLKKAEKIALIHSELSEMLEAVRKGDVENEAEELADTLIRMLDYAGGFNIDLGNAFSMKMFANLNRPFKHNKAF